MRLVRSETFRLAPATRLLLAAGILSLAACGGGGKVDIITLPGGGGGDGGGNGGPITPPVVLAKTGAASGLVTMPPAVAGAAKAAAMSGADVEVRLMTRGNNTLVDTQFVRTNAAGGFEVTVNDPEGKLANGGYMLVTVRKDGFSDASQRIDFDALPERVSLKDSVLTPVTTQVAAKGTSLTASAENGQFTFGLVRMADGTRKALAGSALKAAKAAGASSDLEVNIPAGSLPDTSSLRAQMATFDSSNPTDAQRFPGQYLDSRGYPIVSLGFDYLNISDADSGENIGDMAKAKRAAAGVRKAAIDWNAPTVVTRWLPQGSVSNMLQDACNDKTLTPADVAIPDTTADCNALRQADADGKTLGNESTNGFQLPIYTYDPNTGAWDLFGLGTLVKDYNGNASSMVTYADVKAAGFAEDTKGFQDYAKANQVYVRIYVTNENFQRQYWNLDYPLVFDQPKEVCVQGTLTRSDTGAPMSGTWISMWDDDSNQSFAYAGATTDKDGKFKVSAVLTSATDTDRTAKLNFYNPIDFSSQEVVVTLGEKDNCGTASLEANVLEVAKVTGRVIGKDGNPKVSEWIWGSGGGRYFSAQTGADGRFSAEVRQDTEYVVYFGNSGLSGGSFNANNTVNGTEASDSRTAVTLNDFTVVNRAPEAWGSLSGTSLRLKGSATKVSTSAQINGYDYDGDFPLTWSVRSGTDAVCNANGTSSGGELSAQSVADDTLKKDSYTRKVPLELGEGTHTVVLSVADSLGRATCTTLGTVNVAAALANRAPVIYQASSSLAVAAVGADLVFTGRAYDPDGDAITGNWIVNGQAAPGCGGSVSNGTQACSFKAPGQNAALNVSWTVSDNAQPSANTTRAFNVRVGAAPANLEVTIQSDR